MRTAPAVSLVLAALVLWSAPVYSQVIVNSCNSTTTCVKEGGDCTAPTAANSFVVCATGSYCSSNRCVRQPRLGDTCVATVPCFDEQYPGAVACRGGTCKYSQIYLPGESCNTGSNYDNGGCVYGSCGTDNKCTSIAQNGNCTNAEDLCAPGLYCDDNGACSPRLGQGSACSSNQACDYTLICSSRGATAQPTCVAPFQQSSSQGCSYDLDCKAGLRCNNGVCTTPPSAPSGNCANNQLCGSTSFCVCDTKSKDNTETETGTGQCVAFPGLSGSLVNQLQSFQSCAKSKSCQDIWAFSNAFDSFTDLPRGPNQCTASCSRDLIFDSSVKAGQCFSSAAALVVPALLVMLAAVMALLML